MYTCLKNSFSLVVSFFLINTLFIIFKSEILGGINKTTELNNLLLFITIIFVISMIVTSIFFYFINKNDELVQNYKLLFIVVWLFCVPITCVGTSYYFFSQLPELLSHVQS
jgi:hypothetical protein